MIQSISLDQSQKRLTSGPGSIIPTREQNFNDNSNAGSLEQPNDNSPTNFNMSSMNSPKTKQVVLNID